VCVHDQVLVTPMVDRFLTLSIQLLIRIEVCLAQWAGVSTPSFNKDSILAATATSNSSTAHIESAPSTPNDKYTNSSPAPSSAGYVIGTTNGSSTYQSTPVKSNAVVPPPSQGTVVASTTPSVPPTLHDILAVITHLTVILNWIRQTYTVIVENKVGVAAMSMSPQECNNVMIVARKIVHRQCDKGERTVRALWGKVYQLLEADCRQILQAVRAVAGKFRMTNKPPPETASPYVITILQPIRSFRESFHSLKPIPLSQATHSYQCDGKDPLTTDQFIQNNHTHSSINVVKGMPTDYDNKWEVELAEKVTAHFLQLVTGLMDTARQMDTALQRRSKSGPSNRAHKGAGAAGAATNMTDSEKIQLQLFLDVRAFSAELQSVGLDPATSPSYKALLEEVAEAGSTATATTTAAAVAAIKTSNADA